MNAESPASNPSRAVSSVEVEMSVAAAGELASLPITARASLGRALGQRHGLGAGEDLAARPTRSSPSTQTVKPSYLFACTWIVSGLPSDPSSSASSII